MPSVVRIHLYPRKFSIKCCGNSSVGRAQPCQGWGREFESRFPLFDGALVQLVRIHACHAWGHGFESRTHRKKEAEMLPFLYMALSPALPRRGVGIYSAKMLCFTGFGQSQWCGCSAFVWGKE